MHIPASDLQPGRVVKLNVHTKPDTVRPDRGVIGYCILNIYTKLHRSEGRERAIKNDSSQNWKLQRKTPRNTYESSRDGMENKGPFSARQCCG